MPDLQIHVDFNDLDEGRISALRRHSNEPSAVVLGALVLLLDDEGNSAHGRVTALGKNGLVWIEMLQGTWHSRRHAPTPTVAELERLIYAYSSRTNSFADFYRLSEGPANLAAAASPASYGWPPSMPWGPRAVPSSM
jgi:hypothetical protein